MVTAALAVMDTEFLVTYPYRRFFFLWKLTLPDKRPIRVIYYDAKPNCDYGPVSEVHRSTDRLHQTPGNQRYRAISASGLAARSNFANLVHRVRSQCIELGFCYSLIRNLGEGFRLGGNWIKDNLFLLYMLGIIFVGRLTST